MYNIQIKQHPGGKIFTLDDNRMNLFALNEYDAKKLNWNIAMAFEREYAQPYKIFPVSEKQQMQKVQDGSAD